MRHHTVHRYTLTLEVEIPESVQQTVNAGCRLARDSFVAHAPPEVKALYEYAGDAVIEAAAIGGQLVGVQEMLIRQISQAAHDRQSCQVFDTPRLLHMDNGLRVTFLAQDHGTAEAPEWTPPPGTVVLRA